MAGRDNLEVTIYGMEGVPPNLIEGKYKEVLKKTKLETKEDRADPSKMNPFNGLTTPFISTGGLPIYATASQIVKGQMHAVDSIPNFMAENPNRPHPLLKQSQPTEAAVPTPPEVKDKEENKVNKSAANNCQYYLVFDSPLSAEELLSKCSKYN